MFQDFSQIYQLPASYMAKEGVISVVVDIPMVPITDFGKFALYKHDSLPFLLDGRQVKVKGESNKFTISDWTLFLTDLAFVKSTLIKQFSYFTAFKSSFPSLLVRS